MHCSQWLTQRFVQLKNTVRMRQGELGYSKSEQTYLYDLPVGVGDNCSSNRGAEGAYSNMPLLVCTPERSNNATLRRRVVCYD